MTCYLYYKKDDKTDPIEFSDNITDPYLLLMDGMSGFSEIPITSNSIKINQLQAVCRSIYINSCFDIRHIAFDIIVTGEDFAHVETNRSKLIKGLLQSDKNKVGKLYKVLADKSVWYCNCNISNGYPQFDSVINSKGVKCSIEFEAIDPFWYSEKETTLSKGEIANNGDTYVGGIITLNADGAKNATTGQEIKPAINPSTGEAYDLTDIVVCTEEGNISVMKNKENVLHKLSLNSDFIQFKPGVNKITAKSVSIHERRGGV